jgi:peptide subunit release factor RF-3
MADAGALSRTAANVLDCEVLTEAGRRRAFAVISHPDARAELDHLDYALARRTDAAGARALAGQRRTEVLTRRHDGALLALFSDRWRLGQVQRDHHGILLEPLIAG